MWTISSTADQNQMRLGEKNNRLYQGRVSKVGILLLNRMVTIRSSECSGNVIHYRQYTLRYNPKTLNGYF